MSDAIRNTGKKEESGARNELTGVGDDAERVSLATKKTCELPRRGETRLWGANEHPPDARVGLDDTLCSAGSDEQVELRRRIRVFERPKEWTRHEQVADSRQRNDQHTRPLEIAEGRCAHGVREGIRLV